LHYLTSLASPLSSGSPLKPLEPEKPEFTDDLTRSSGFPLALNRNYNYILAGLVIVVFPTCFFVLFFRGWMSRRRARARANPSTGYDAEPWRQADPNAQRGNGYDVPPAYDASQQNVGLADLNAAGRKERSGGRRNDLGPPVVAREFA
jgi:hypothetical protein